MMMASGFDKVYEIAPIFRAEEHDTLRHLNEVISIDVETAFTDHVDAMDILERMVVKAIKEVKENCQEELDTLEFELKIPETPFPRIEYDEMVEHG